MSPGTNPAAAVLQAVNVRSVMLPLGKFDGKLGLVQVYCVEVSLPKVIEVIVTELPKLFLSLSKSWLLVPEIV